MRPPGDLIAARIMRMIGQRRRYRYVRPRVLRDGDGWKIVSPNCSRNIDPQGGEIDIAWFVPLANGRWQAHARDHACAAWVRQGEPGPLPDVLSVVCADPSRVFWP